MTLARQTRKTLAAKIKVLVADDEPAIADYIAACLNQWNCKAAVEYSGADAVRRADTFRPDVALLGLVMPHMGGVEAGIKLMKKSPDTKVVLITEPVPAETLERLKAQGYKFETLPAPFSREQLHDVIFGGLANKGEQEKTDA